jgi:plastocyanin
VDELGIDQEMDAGETKIFNFTFSKAGVYKLFCIPHESLGMVGEIVVE